MDHMDEPTTVGGGIIIVGSTLATRIEEKTAHMDRLHASLDSEEFLKNCISAAHRGGLNDTRDVAPVKDPVADDGGWLSAKQMDSVLHAPLTMTSGCDND
jgi:hypothetical protein